MRTFFRLTKSNIQSLKSTNEKKRIGYSRLRQQEKQSCSSGDEDEEFTVREFDLTKNIIMGGSKGNYDMRHEFENSYEELVGSKNRIRRIRIILLIGAAVVVIALIAAAVLLLVKANDNDDSDDDNIEGDRLKLEDILRGTFATQRFNGSWISGSEILYKDQAGSVISYDVSTGQSKAVGPRFNDRIQEAFVYERSADGKYLLIGRDPQKLYRHSYLAYYDIVNLESGIPEAINLNGKPQQLLFVKWSPVGNGLIFNFNRNLYYKPTATASEIQLTFDSSAAVLNGHPDWVYEEEVLSSNTATWFNPTGTQIAFIQFDDSSTRTMTIPFYGIPGLLAFQYPLSKSLLYPKAGSNNPFIRLLRMDLQDAVAGEVNAIDILVPSPINTESHLLASVEWLDGENLLSCWMNRIQNQAYIQVSNSTKRFEIFKSVSKTGWLDFFTPPLPNKDGSEIALILPQKQGDDGDYQHLSLLSTKNTISTPVAITSGKYVVQSIQFWNQDTNFIYYMANTPEKSEILHLYGVKARQGLTPKCLTCGIRSSEDIEQTFFSAEFSTNGQYVVINSLGPSVPFTEIYQVLTENDDIQLKKILTWEKNAVVRFDAFAKALPESEFHTIDLENGFTAKVNVLVPPGIDRSGAKKYPMLVDVYGGPDSNAVSTKWAIDWGTYLSSAHSVVYARIDGRGSGLRGDKLLHSIYLQLGTVEVEDQINATRKLQKLLPYVDEKRTGIWGWSYGGFAAAMALAKDNSTVFRCATSVAPVTDWLYYDSIYTERFMNVPSKNQIGYQNSRLTQIPKLFKGKKFMLVHGTMDDNVHYQQSMMFARSLERNDVMFRQISYPDEDHGLAGVRPHLYHSLSDFFGECFEEKSMRVKRK